MQKTILGLMFVLGTACAPGSGESERTVVEVREDMTGGAAEERAIPRDIRAMEIRNARMPAPNLLTGGQITREQMAALRNVGYRTFISLRPASEPGAEWEEEFAAANNIEFLRLPVEGAAGVTRENAERLAGMIEGVESEPTIVYCGSGNRVGALLALKAHFVDGESAEEGLAFGKQAGLTRLERKVRELLGIPPE